MKGLRFEDVLIIVAFLIVIGGLVSIVFLTIATGDVKDFSELPTNNECVVVEWEENPLKGETINRSGIYCLTDVEK